MAYNQGFYNLALAVGVFVGIVMLGRDGSAGRRREDPGRVRARLHGGGRRGPRHDRSTGTGRAAAIQFVPAALALALTVAA